MKRYILFFILAATVCAFAQEGSAKYVNPFDGKWVIGIDGGATWSMTDFKSKANLIGGGSLTNYFYSSDIHTFGLRVFGKAGYLSGEYDKYSPSVVGYDKFKTDIYTLGGGLEYLLHLDDAFLPYVFVGASHLWYDPKDDDGHRFGENAKKLFDRTDLVIHGEIGFKTMLSEDFSMNLGVMYNHSLTDELDNVFTGDNKDGYLSASIGFSYILNVPKDSDGDGVIDALDKCPDTPLNVKVDEFGCPLDSDGDGVPDYLDKCPDTPKGAKIDQNGCPLDSDGDNVPDYLDKCPNTPKGVTVDKNGCPVDSDKDGVPDYLDKCPNTPSGVMVDKTGCPLDSDGDGVPDYLDKCPNTAKGLKVDKNGCPEIPKEAPKVIDLSGKTNFATGKATLLPAAYEELDKLVTFMNDYKETRWKVEGHTDSKGQAAKNKKLSLDRANSVIDYFVSHGIEKSRFEAFGFGPDKPIADNKTEAGRAKNRRVTITRLD
jgi:outer membrane protein OmpA-like peptidoglycan-associated protein